MRAFVVALLLISASIAQSADAPANNFSAQPLQGFALFGRGATMDEDDLLPPEQAFKLSVQVRDSASLVARFEPAESYYLYRDKIIFSVAGNEGVAIASVRLPLGELKTDPIFGRTEVYHKPFDALIELNRSDAEPGAIALQASYQGCSEKGVCYPPIKQTFNLTLTRSGEQAGIVPDGSNSPAPDELQTIEHLFKSGSFWLIVASFFGFGLALAFTPCVLPMIPILAGIIAGQRERVTRGRGLALSTAYVLGMALTYALAGIAAALSGALIASSLQNPWVLGSFALIFVLLSLSMFGLYELQLPSFFAARMGSASNRLSGGRIAGVFAMGALSALIVSPCVAAPLAGALLYIGQSGSIALGGMALFAMAVGMGVPLLVVGVSAGALLPKAGPWMEAVKKFFGVVLLAVAIWIVRPVIPAQLILALWAGLLIISAVYLRAIDPLPPSAGGPARLGKGLGVIALVTGVALLVGGLSGARDPLQPLARMRGDLSAEVGPTFERINSLAELEDRLRTAARPVMLDFYADWCVSCKEMEEFTFTDPRVQARLQQMLVLQADVTKNSPEHQALLKRFGLYGPPGIIFFDAQGNELKPYRVIGYQSAERFLAGLERVIAKTVGERTLTFSSR